MKIGEIIKHKGQRLIVAESECCKKCRGFQDEDVCFDLPHCQAFNGKEAVDVIFVEVPEAD